MQTARVSAVLFVCGAALMPAVPSAGAEKIQLKGGQEFSGTVLGKNGQHVVIQVDRSEVAAINGQPLPEPVTIGAKAPAFQAVDLTGATQTLAGSKAKATLLKFWATWCPHCRSDVPLMKDLYARYHDKGFRLLTVSVDQDLGKLRAFVNQEHVPYPVIPASDPSASAEQAGLPALYETGGIPAYFLIDEAGTIVKASSGSFTEGRVDLENILKPLLEKTSKR